MYGYFTPVLILQIFCVYHVYRNHGDQKWYFLIIFFPLFGSLIYLYFNFVNRQNVESLTEGVKSLMNTNYEIEKLEKELRFSDTVANKVKLAEAYINGGRYADAVELYENCVGGIYSEKDSFKVKLLKAYFLNGDYEKAASLGKEIKWERELFNAQERIAFAQSLHQLGKIEEAREVFDKMDVQFANYPHRLAYSRFLAQVEEQQKAKEILDNLLTEIEHMDGYEKRMKRGIYNEVKVFYNSF